MVPSSVLNLREWICSTAQSNCDTKTTNLSAFRIAESYTIQMQTSTVSTRYAMARLFDPKPVTDDICRTALYHNLSVCWAGM
ncbi:hypothetical protein NPIL_220621 [Nephila pilipes]|uniref:Uncharacterized protein n=1 Tax=Nephila pilipes TaxID=299642 RepID=A0A8X6TQ68_NEPPI|nr:hypothetical protein NPIL_220621 [Nephila pilipes]